MKFIDLFAGLGGFRLGLERLGLKCVFSCEIDETARQVYKDNFGELPHGDIRKVDAQSIPDHDILCGGFPCQAFSLTGQMTGFKHKDGNLYLEVTRILKHKKPRFFILENVKGLEYLEKKAYIKQIIQNLNGIGYQIKILRLNSGYFSVPQSRERIYIVGFKDDQDFFSFEEPKPTGRKNLKDILDPNPEDYLFLKEKRASKFTAFKKDKPLNYQSKLLHQVGIIDEAYKSRARIYSPELCSPTIVAHSDTTKILVDGRIRYLSRRELLQCQGFPKDFKMEVSFTKHKKLVGNAVTTNVITEIGRSLKTLGEPQL